MLARLTEVRSALGELARAHREAGRHVPHPPETGLVLEVGSGQAPHPRADALVDKYVVDDFERPHEGAIDFTKPFVVADGHALPFADGSFVYVIALHVLEHATRPERFAAELGRIAPAGFVQVPTSVSELTFGWPYHPWLIERDGETLVFRARDGLRAPCGDVFHDAYAGSALFRNWWASRRSLFHHSIEWRGELSTRVEGESTAEATAELDVEKTLALLGHLHRRGALRPLPPKVIEVLRCPECRSSLAFDEGEAACTGCERVYPVAGEVPVLLREAAR